MNIHLNICIISIGLHNDVLFSHNLAIIRMVGLIYHTVPHLHTDLHIHIMSRTVVCVF